MVIGTSYILGITLPENFKMPFISVDMKDFWSRWHISLSTWLRDYVYSRFVMDSLKKQRFRGKRTASYIGYILTMMTMGIWHGLTPAYFIYGAYHALLMCVNEALDLHWKPFRKMKQQGLTQVILVVVTFHLFSFGLLDSFGIVQLLVELETQLGIVLDIAALTREEIATSALIVERIRREGSA